MPSGTRRVWRRRKAAFPHECTERHKEKSKMHGECKLLFTDPTKNVQADINLFFCSVTPCADWLQAHAKAAWNVFNHASKSTIPQKSLVSVKVWNTKLDRENRFQTFRAQSEPKPNKTKRESFAFHSHTFRSRGSWANVHVGKQIRAQKLSEFLWDEQTGLQSN
jgi:hypothetical protein